MDSAASLGECLSRLHKGKTFSYGLVGGKGFLGSWAGSWSGGFLFYSTEFQAQNGSYFYFPFLGLSLRNIKNFAIELLFLYVVPVMDRSPSVVNNKFTIIELAT